MAGMQESALKTTVCGHCCKWGGMALFGLLSDDRCRLRRNQFFACFDPILVERLFSVIPSRCP